MKKRILSVVLAIAMIVCMIPISTMTASALTTRSWNGATWYSLNNSFPNSGHWYVEKDYTFSGKKALEGDLYLDLNGHTITFSGTQGGSAIDLGTNKNLYLYDSVGGGKLYRADSGGYDRCVWVDGGASFYMYGGRIENFRNWQQNGGAVCVNNGYFRMNGGTIYWCFGQDGGAVFVNSNSTFDMYGGDIYKNGAWNSGGGVGVSGGKFNMYGGYIDYNHTEQTSKYIYGGGGVAGWYGATINMSGGSIYENETVQYGAGVMISEATFTMSGGYIHDNGSAPSGGGGAYIASSGTFNMSNGSIYNNTAGNYGGGVFSYGNFTMSGGSIYSNTAGADGGGVNINGCNFTMSGGNIYDNTANNGGAICSYNVGTFKISGGRIGKNTANSYSGIAVNSGNKPTYYSGRFCTANTYTKAVSGTSTISFDQNYGTGGASSFTQSWNSTLPNVAVPTRTGYTFNGYSNSNREKYYNANGTPYSKTYDGTKWDYVGAQTLTANWTEHTATLAYNNNGYGTAPNAVTMKYTAATNAAAAISADGLIFTGWNTETDGTGTAYQPGDVVKAASVDPVATTLYAQWHEHSFTGEYKDNGDGTHQQKCTGCDEYGTAENHTFTNGVCVCGLKQIAVPTAVEGLAYNGTELTGVENGTGYTLTGNTAINAGTYTATATLQDGYVWEDGTTENKTITWEIFSSQATIIAGKLRTLYADVTVEDNTIVLTGYKNTNSIVVYAKGIDGKDVNVTMAGTPITKLSNGTGFVLTYKNRVKSGENVTTTIAVDNCECTLIYKFETQQTPAKDDVKTLRTFDVDINETDHIITLTSNVDAPYVNLYVNSSNKKSFTYTLETSENVEMANPGQYRIYRPSGASQITLPMEVKAGVLGTTDYTLVVNFTKAPFNPTKYIVPIYGGLELKNDGEEDYILLSMTSGKDFVGFKTAGISGATLSFDPASADGVVDEHVSGGKITQYRVYKSKNPTLEADDSASVTGSINIKFNDGTEETYKIVFAFEPMNFSANAISATHVQSVEYDSENQKMVFIAEGASYIHIRTTLTNGLKVSAADPDGKIVSYVGELIRISCPASGIAKFNLAVENGKEIECTVLFKDHCTVDDEGNIIGDKLAISAVPVSRGILSYDEDNQLVCKISSGKSSAAINELTELGEEVSVELVKGVTYDEATGIYKISTSVAGQHITMTVSGVKYDVLIAKS